MSATIAIDDLRVGMFVHLDLGWWAHPFALSSFKLTSADQITTIRGLGLTQVRWSPEKSSADPGGDVPASTAANAASSSSAPAAQLPATDAPAIGTPAHDAVATGAAQAAEAAPGRPGPSATHGHDAAAVRARRAQLSAQREATRLCTAQYGEATKSLKATIEGVFSQPEQARQSAEALTRALLDKMLIDGELCIRVLG